MSWQKKASFPLPTASEVLANLQGGQVFFRLDLAQTYQHLRVTLETAKVLTINNLKGLYAVNRLPFRISAAPAIFQRFMETLLAGVQGTSVYLDDVIIAGRTMKGHNESLKTVLQRLVSANLRFEEISVTSRSEKFATWDTELTLRPSILQKRRCKHCSKPQN